MVSISRLRTLLVVAALCALGSIALAASAQAAPPYPPRPPAISVNVTTIAPGGSVTVSGAGFLPNELVSIDIGGVHLATVRANANGVVVATVSIPAGLSGNESITMTGLGGSGTTLTVGVDVTSPAAPNNVANNGIPNSGGGGGGGLPNTGVAVIGIGSVGLVLLATGAVLMVAGRRRARADLR